ncbi:hypothetical protein [Terribacillus sp. JSM ZJ617]|uniref:hypothetical protein n=1 Tax=Terribacillus sp. JSM ZJ617 TaxID=3342119 RepID=UPI0035A91442
MKTDDVKKLMASSGITEFSMAYMEAGHSLQPVMRTSDKEAANINVPPKPENKKTRRMAGLLLLRLLQYI